MKRILVIAVLMCFMLTAWAAANPLHKAAFEGDLEAVKNWLKHAPKTIDMQDANGVTPLCYATEFSNKEMVKLLLASGANPNATDNKGWAPLHYVMWSKTPDRVEKARLLIDYKANINQRAPHHCFTPIFYALMHKQRELVQFCVDNGADLKMRMNMNSLTPLEYAKKYWNVPDITRMLETY